MGAERIRALRGFSRHCRAWISDHGMAGRQVVGTLYGRGKGSGYTYGTCKWCGVPARSIKTGCKRLWHDECLRFYTVAMGIRGSLTTGFVIRRSPCPCGAAGTELDHKLAIGLARRQGIRSFLRAFLPDNLQWRCHECHLRKTRADRMAMKGLTSSSTRVEKSMTLWPIKPCRKCGSETQAIGEDGACRDWRSCRARVLKSSVKS